MGYLDGAPRTHPALTTYIWKGLLNPWLNLDFILKISIIMVGVRIVNFAKQGPSGPSLHSHTCLTLNPLGVPGPYGIVREAAY